MRLVITGPPTHSDSQCSSVDRTTPKIVPFHWGIWTPFNTWFFGPTRVYNPIDISMGSVVFAGLTDVTNRQTHRQTDRPRYSVCNIAAMRLTKLYLLLSAEYLKDRDKFSLLTFWFALDSIIQMKKEKQTLAQMRKAACLLTLSTRQCWQYVVADCRRAASYRHWTRGVDARPVWWDVRSIVPGCRQSSTAHSLGIQWSAAAARPQYASSCRRFPVRYATSPVSTCRRCEKYSCVRNHHFFVLLYSISK